MMFSRSSRHWSKVTAMVTNKKPTSNKFIGAGIIASIAASLCCIEPVFAIISGASGIAGTFSWLDPLRPYLIALTVLSLGLAWYVQLKPKREIDCDCETDGKPSLLQSKKFLGIITVFAIVMLAFPAYSHIFYGDIDKPKDAETAYSKQVTLNIEGMTCTSCEEHITHEINQLDGIAKVNSSYEKGISEVAFDESKVSLDAIIEAVNATGYSVIGIQEPGIQEPGTQEPISLAN